MAYLAENITTAGAKSGVAVACPCGLKFQGKVALTSIQFSVTDADYVPLGGRNNINEETVVIVDMDGTFYLRPVVNHVDSTTNFDIEIVVLG